jgi:hypothetical protein
MSDRNRTPFTHPYLFFITNVGMQFNHELLTSKGATGERAADKNMLYVIATFEHTMKEELKTQIEWLLNQVQLTPEEKERWNVYSTIYDAWHRAGYFTMAKYMPPTRTTGLTELAKKLGVEE